MIIIETLIKGEENNQREWPTRDWEDDHHALGPEDHPENNTEAAPIRREVTCQPTKQEIGTGNQFSTLIICKMNYKPFEGLSSMKTTVVHCVY